MDFKDKDGGPLVGWTDPEGGFEAWKRASKGYVPDYSGMTYAQLTGGSGVQWPVNDQHPKGTERLYTDGVFNTQTDRCETYGHDLMTGAANTSDEFKALNPNGRAWIKSADHVEPPEPPNADYPLLLTTGRVVYHFHTRTKTGRTPELEAAAPAPFVQISEPDATELGISDDDPVEVTSRRGSAFCLARVGGIEPGTVFMPFHFGSWDRPGGHQAANELTITGWDPVSKQPYLKFAAVRVRLASDVREPVLSETVLPSAVREDAADEDPGTVPMKAISR